MKTNIFIKNFFISTGISLGIILTLEIFYRIAVNLNIKRSFNINNLELIQIAKDKKYTKREISEMLRSQDFNNDITYKPWVQIGNPDIKGKYSIVENGKRKTIESALKCKERKLVWFFGGSTTFGTGVTWQETIPSQFVDLATKRQICVEAVNHGIPYHYSLQEAMNLIFEISNTKKLPDHVIFVDGLNDFIQPQSSINKEPFFTPVLKNYFSKNKTAERLTALDEPIIEINLSLIDFLRYKLFKVEEKFPSNYSFPKNINTKDIALTISSKLKENRRIISMVCKHYSIKCHQFMQPVPSLFYNPNYDENLTTPLRGEFHKELFSVGYYDAIYNNEINAHPYLRVYDASKILAQYEDGIPYVDSFHYSPRAIKVFSHYIFNKINL